MSKYTNARSVLGPLSLRERLLLVFSVEPAGASGSYVEPGTDWDVEGALDELRRTFPDLDGLVAGKRVLDYGCGDGYQSVALRLAGAEVMGVDIERKRIRHARELAGKHGLDIEFATVTRGDFDVAVSQNAFEHMPDPEASLAEIFEILKPGGKLLLCFGPPWYAPYGSHMYFFTRLPWVNLLFPERVVMRIRSLYRADGLQSYAPELNRMSIRRFEQVVRRSPFELSWRRYRCSWGLHWLARVPILRELLINRVEAVLQKPWLL
ncbi:class I SAM-dependent methyltransferase [Oceanibacterium hippocampi]|uniref:Ubiquinone biosynthesis O-methyltransferase n=1 Tax=Oceanibacterium hippocampi TaxID=745714 RepID=A0A1Y5S398_9PROT|nr:class I SAM-dependent methyltransferase [Oceanibacterium hippocampi]SLN31363.1 Ubiquinone biosynthesis O-methyltransferase [Oceanibacterium hippocampi]